jgi:hypothetical protein
MVVLARKSPKVHWHTVFVYFAIVFGIKMGQLLLAPAPVAAESFESVI